MVEQHITGMKYTVSADFDADIEIVTGIDGDVWDINGPHFCKVIPEIKPESVTGITGEKNIRIIAEQCVKTDFDCDISTYTDEYSVYKKLSFKASADREYSFEKIVVIKTSCDDFECKSYVVVSYTDAKKRILMHGKKFGVCHT